MLVISNCGGDTRMKKQIDKAKKWMLEWWAILWTCSKNTHLFTLVQTSKKELKKVTNSSFYQWFDGFLQERQGKLLFWRNSSDWIWICTNRKWWWGEGKEKNTIYEILLIELDIRGVAEIKNSLPFFFFSSSILQVLK